MLVYIPYMDPMGMGFGLCQSVTQYLLNASHGLLVAVGTSPRKVDVLLWGASKSLR